jgi:hypothetical protein
MFSALFAVSVVEVGNSQRTSFLKKSLWAKYTKFCGSAGGEFCLPIGGNEIKPGSLYVADFFLPVLSAVEVVLSLIVAAVRAGVLPQRAKVSLGPEFRLSLIGNVSRSAAPRRSLSSRLFVKRDRELAALREQALERDERMLAEMGGAHG